jgi:hypothetical protein
MFRKCILQLCGLAIAISSGSVALGQYQSLSPTGSAAGTLNQMALRNAQQAMQQSYTQQQSGMPGAGRIGLGLDTSFSGTKPFSGFSQGPTVSPYLNLFRTDANGAVNPLNYNTLVEPQLRQQQLNKQQQQENTQTTRRLQAISAQADYNVQGSKEEYPTGHQTVFQYMDHYYPQQRPHKKKGAR